MDEDSIARSEISREFSKVVDLARRVVRETIDEYVGEPVSDDVEAGVPEKLPFQDVAESHSVTPAYESRGEKGVATAGMTNEQQVGAASEVRIVVDLQAHRSAVPHHASSR
jgi:hypothetical protein